MHLDLITDTAKMALTFTQSGKACDQKSRPPSISSRSTSHVLCQAEYQAHLSMGQAHCKRITCRGSGLLCRQKR